MKEPRMVVDSSSFLTQFLKTLSQLADNLANRCGKARGRTKPRLFQKGF